MQVWTGRLTRMEMNRHPGPPPLTPASCGHSGRVSTSGRRADAEGGVARCQRSARRTQVQPAASKVTGVVGGRSGERAEPQAQAHTASLGSRGTAVDPELWEPANAPGADEDPPCWLSAAVVRLPRTRRRNEHLFRHGLSSVLLSIAGPCFPKS